MTDDVEGLAAFLRTVFRATGDVHPDRPAVLRIGDSNVMLSGVGPRPATPAFLYVYVVYVDAAWQRAVDAGSRSLEAPSDLPYGDRRGMVDDRWGNVWQIATFKG